MSHNPRFTLDSSIKNVSISHRGRQVIHDSFLQTNAQRKYPWGAQITRPLYPTKTITYKHNALNQRVAKLPRSHVARGNAYSNPNYQKRSTSNKPSTLS